jgi:hypothetical protein
MQYYFTILILVFISADLSSRISLSQTAYFGVPFEKDSKFIGREDIILEISRQFEVRRCVALAGIGGVG